MGSGVDQLLAMTAEITMFDATIVWLKRATGIGYKTYDPLVGGDIDIDEVTRKIRRADRLVRDVERLERELRRIGLPV